MMKFEVNLMARTPKEITYKFESRSNTNKSDVYLVDVIFNKVRYKYTYSTTKYGTEVAEELAKKMAELLTAALIDESIDISSVSKINNLYKEFEDRVEIYTLCAATKELHTIIVDKDDYPKVKEYYWSLFNANKNFNNLYATTTKGGTTYRMSHIVLGLKPGSHIVRYRNGNQLDNRKENLMVCSYNPKKNDGVSMSTSVNSELVGRVRIVGNTFRLNYCTDQDNNIWETAIFDISDYSCMEAAYRAAKAFRKNYKLNE